MQPEYEQLELTICPNCNTMYDPQAHTNSDGSVQCPGCNAHINLLE